MLAQGKPSTVPSPHLRKSALISPRRISGLRLVSVPRVHSVHSFHFVSIRVDSRLFFVPFEPFRGSCISFSIICVNLR
jgi:hypothetical protein